MTNTDISWLNALSGGFLIGLAAILLMLALGQISGISGILSHCIKFKNPISWQWAFIGGLVVSGLMAHWLIAPLLIQIDSNLFQLVLGGLLVGFGTRMASGCTSGHGVCGIARFSFRSIAATAVFISTGMLTVFIVSLA